MKLLSLNKKIFFFLIFSILSTSISSDEGVNIWKKENLEKKKNTLKKTVNTSAEQNQSKIDISKKTKTDIILDENNLTENKKAVYGIYEPDENNLTLEMWVNSEGTRVKDTIERIQKIKLSQFSEELFVNTLFTISYLPSLNMTDEQFIKYKIDWLIKNKRDDLISLFLNKNNNFPNKGQIIRYLVDENILKGNIKEACEKIDSIDNNVKDNYLDKFKIICLIDANKKNEAQMVHDLLKEQKISNKFFDDKINFLLEISDKEDNKIDDSSLLNFYLSSIAITNFNYKPTKKTNKKIWQYLITANLLKSEFYEDKKFINALEVAANIGSFEFSYILDIYKNIKFNLNDFLDVDNNYKKFHPVDTRALVFQKILLSDNNENKLKYLFLLNDLFKENKLPNIFKNYLSNQLAEIKKEGIPLEYETLVENNILVNKKKVLTKIKYDDSKYYSSKVLKFYTEKNVSLKKLDKDFKSVHKKIKKNKKYKFSLKDVILFDSLENEKYVLPKELNYEKIKNNNSPPIELLNMVKNNEIGMLLLRIVELVGEDEILDLDSQTVYFINHLFIKAGLLKLNKKILETILPERV
jgi:hypothetical protein